MTRRPAIFLDRDGVIIENRADYVRGWEDVAWLPGALAALAELAAGPLGDWPVVIVTNQSAVGQGLVTLETAEGINDRLVGEIRAAGGRVDSVYLCPHTDADGCDCRKPAPGLLLKAAVELDLDLGRSLLVGDALGDIAAARAAGVGAAILVRTGRGHEQAQLPQAAGLQPLWVCDTLADALTAWATTGLSPERMD